MNVNLISENLTQVVRDNNPFTPQLQPLTTRTSISDIVSRGTPLLVQENSIQIGDFKISVQKLGELLKVLAEEHPEIIC